MDPAVRSLWQNLDKMLEKNPEQYDRMMRQCAEMAKFSAPQPFKCIEVSTTSQNDKFFVNLLTWDKVPKDSVDKGEDALPLCGGEIGPDGGGDFIINVAAHPQNAKFTNKIERDNFVQIVLAFISHVNKTEFNNDWTFYRGGKYKGDLKLIQDSFTKAISSPQNPSIELLTPTPKSLLDLKLERVESREKRDLPKELLLEKTTQEDDKQPKRKLIREYDPKREEESDSSFERNLKSAFLGRKAHENTSNGKDGGEKVCIKLRREETHLAEVSTTKKVIRKDKSKSHRDFLVGAKLLEDGKELKMKILMSTDDLGAKFELEDVIVDVNDNVLSVKAREIEFRTKIANEANRECELLAYELCEDRPILSLSFRLK